MVHDAPRTRCPEHLAPDGVRLLFPHHHHSSPPCSARPPPSRRSLCTAPPLFLSPSQSTLALVASSINPQNNNKKKKSISPRDKFENFDALYVARFCGAGRISLILAQFGPGRRARPMRLPVTATATVLARALHSEVCTIVSMSRGCMYKVYDQCKSWLDSLFHLVDLYSSNSYPQCA